MERISKGGRYRKEYKCSVDPSHKVVCFDSQKEHRRYVELRLLEKGGKICLLTVHPKYPLIVSRLGGDVDVGLMIPDFAYIDKTTGQTVVEDVKGYMSPKGPQKGLFEIKCNLMKALYGIEVKVI